MHLVGGFEDTHNYYVKVMLEMGIVGLIVFLGIISRMFTAGYSLFRTALAEDFLRGMGLGLAGMVVTTMVANAFGDRWTYIEETGFLWVIAAMAIRGRMIEGEETVVEQNAATGKKEGASGDIRQVRSLARGGQSETN